jgi:hypothetical protein
MVTDHLSAELDVLPALQQVVGGLSVGDNPDLQRIVRLGAPGLVVGALLVSRNPLLTDVSGLSVASVGASQNYCTDNASLPSCACEALMPPPGYGRQVFCYGNAPDTCSDDPADLCY